MIITKQTSFVFVCGTGLGCGYHNNDDVHTTKIITKMFFLLSAAQDWGAEAKPEGEGAKKNKDGILLLLYCCCCMFIVLFLLY